MIKFWKKLDNPFLLAAEGFVAGAILFWAFAPDSKANEDATIVSKPTAAAQIVSPLQQIASPAQHMGSH